MVTVATGSKFRVELLFQTKNGTGTGEIDLLINTVDGIPVGENELEEPLKPGAYSVSWTIDAKPNPNCDPSQELCEEWLPGNYIANVGEYGLTAYVYLCMWKVPCTCMCMYCSILNGRGFGL